MRLLKNTVANTAGAFLGPVLALFLTPFYIRHLGLEGFGLVGFFSAFSMLLGVVTAAMGKVYLRDMAMRASQTDRVATAPALFKTFLLLFAALGLAVGFAVAGASWVISHRWVHLQHLAPATVQSCVVLIGALIGCSFPMGICLDTLAALEEQVQANAAVMVVSLVTSLAAAAAVFWTDSVIAYYGATTMGALATLLILWSRSAKALRARTSDSAEWPSFGQAIRQTSGDARVLARASLGLIWTEAAGVAITQTDRMLIASGLPLSTLGTYNVGSSIGRLVQMLCSGYVGAAFPQLCAAAAAPRPNAAAALAFQQQGVVMTLACAVALPVCAVPESILRLWIGKPEIVAEASRVTFLFAIAYGCLALAAPPYNFAVALGKLRYAAIQNLLSVVWYPLLGYWLVSRYGLIGAALLWLTYCVLAVVSCTLIAGLVLSRSYCSWAGLGRMLLLPACAVGVGCLIRLAPTPALHPDAVRIFYACFGSTLVLGLGFPLVLGLAKTADLLNRLKLPKS